MANTTYPGYGSLAITACVNSRATRCPSELPAIKWSDLGLSVPGCKSDEIVVVSRQNNSGTYAFFQQAVLGKKGKYRMGTLDMHGSRDVVDLVEKTPCAIGYSGLAYATDHIKMACIEAQPGAACVTPSVATAVIRLHGLCLCIPTASPRAPSRAISTGL
jgi:hypothetical protein